MTPQQHTNDEKFMDLIESISRQLDFFINPNQTKRGYILIATEEAGENDNIAVVLNTNNREKLVIALANFISASKSKELCNEAALLALNVSDIYLYENNSEN